MDGPLTEAQCAALRSQLHVYTNSEETWAELQRHGATNDEIVELLGYLWDYGCGQGHPNRLSTFAHGRPPRLWFSITGGYFRESDGRWCRREPDLKGLDLVRAVRQVMGVGEKDP